MSRARTLGAAVCAWLADRADVRRTGSSVLRPRYWFWRLTGHGSRAAAKRVEARDD